MNTNFRTLLTLLAASTLVVTSASGAEREKETSATGATKKKATFATDRTDKAKITKIDLRSHMKQMKLRDGKNIVYEGPNYKLIAVAKGGKVSDWVATDNNGKSLPTTLSQGVITCQVCITIKSGGGSSDKTCTEVDCSILEKPKTAEKAQ